MVSISIFLILPVIILLDKLLFLIPAISLGFGAILWGRKFLLFFVIISYLTLVGDVIADYRLIVHAINIFILLYFFFSDYGFNFNKYPVVPKQLMIFNILLFAVMFTSTVLSDHIFLGVSQIFKTAYFLAVVYLLYSMINKEDDIWFYINTVLLASLIMAFSTFYELSKLNFDFLSFSVDTQFRSGGLILNVNAVAGFFSVAIPLTASLFFIDGYKKYKGLLWGMILIFFLGLTITVSRSGFLSVFISLSLILFVFKRRVLFRSLAILLVIITILFLIDEFRDVFFSLTRISQGLSQRDHLWLLTLAMIRDNFIFGVGPGAWSANMFSYFPVMIDSFEGQLFLEMFYMTEGANASHNLYLVFFSEMGILGIFVILLLIHSFYSITKNLLDKIDKHNRTIYPLVIGIGAIISGMLVRAFFDSINIFTFGWISVDLPFWFTIIIISYLYKNEPDKYSI